MRRVSSCIIGSLAFVHTCSALVGVEVGVGTSTLPRRRVNPSTAKHHKHHQDDAAMLVSNDTYAVPSMPSALMRTKALAGSVSGIAPRDIPDDIDKKEKNDKDGKPKAPAGKDSDGKDTRKKPAPKDDDDTDPRVKVAVNQKVDVKVNFEGEIGESEAPPEPPEEPEEPCYAPPEPCVGPDCDDGNINLAKRPWNRNMFRPGRKCVDPPGPKGKSFHRCLFGNSLDDGFQYIVNYNRGSTRAHCGPMVDCECCRFKKSGKRPRVVPAPAAAPPPCYMDAAQLTRQAADPSPHHDHKASSHKSSTHASSSPSRSPHDAHHKTDKHHKTARHNAPNCPENAARFQNNPAEACECNSGFERITLVDGSWACKHATKNKPSASAVKRSSQRKGRK